MKTRKVIQSLRNHLRPLAGVACAVLGLAAQPALATTITYDFEPSSGYTTGDNNLAGQDGWSIQFGNGGSVQTYGTGEGIAWRPLSAALPAGSSVRFQPPVNPTGGNNYMGKSVLVSTGGGGGGRDLNDAALTGTVTVRTDFINGPEHDFPNFQGSILSRGPGGEFVTGIFTQLGSLTVDDNTPPRQGNWAFGIRAHNAAGAIVKQGYDPYYRLNGIAGFDELPRETWFRIGYTYDTTSRQITQLYSKNLVTGQEWTIDNPQFEQFTTNQAGVPIDNGPGGPMYMYGGATGTIKPDGGATGIIDPVTVGLYNVGNGQVHCFDNVVITNDVVPPPIFQITSIVRNPVSGEVTLTFPSTSGATYAVDYSSDNLETWLEITDNLPGQSGETEFTDVDVDRNAADELYYRVRQP